MLNGGNIPGNLYSARSHLRRRVNRVSSFQPGTRGGKPWHLIQGISYLRLFKFISHINNSIIIHQHPHHSQSHLIHHHTSIIFNPYPSLSHLPFCPSIVPIQNITHSFLNESNLKHTHFLNNSKSNHITFESKSF